MIDSFLKEIKDSGKAALEKYKNNNDFNFNCSSRFEDEVNKYSYMWKREGEYSKKGVS